MFILFTCMNEDPIKNGGVRVLTRCLWELSVAMETGVLIRSGPKPYAVFPPPNDAPDEILFQSAC